LPVLVSEGDSWFQFPLLISEIVDQLGDEFLIWSTGAAGDTARNMVIDNPEYMKALRKHKDHVQGFLFSAAGNDVIGEDPDTGRAALLDLLKDFNGNTNDVVGHVNLAALGETLAFLHSAYSEVIETVRAERGFGALPIFIHGYDYAFPYPWRNNDKRNPVYAANDGWLGQPLAAHGIVDDGLRRKIIMFMIDALYDMLATLAGNSQASGVWVVNCRGAMPRLSDWADEIHGTSAGFAKVAARFRPVIRSAI
jgi:N-acetylmuramoyl-L-alanine amidase